MLTPGSHYVIITADVPRDGVQARTLGLELRDSLAIFMPGQILHALLLRVPLKEKTVAAQAMATGTGAINIEGCRVSSASEDARGLKRTQGSPESFYKQDGRQETAWEGVTVSGSDRGRWPANVLLIHGPDCKHDCQPDCPVRLLDAQSGDRPTGPAPTYHTVGKFSGTAYAKDDYSVNLKVASGVGYADSGGASRFYPQFESLKEAVVWLNKLVQSGSSTTG